VSEELKSKFTSLLDLLRKSLVEREHYPPKASKYEIARIISARALQLAQGAKPLIDVTNLPKDPVIIAIEEFKQGKLSFFKVVRVLPDNKRVELNVEELLKMEKELIG